MAARKRGLGRGLESLLSADHFEPSATPTTDNGLRTLPVDTIQRGKYQPRHDMHTESLEDLAGSIRAQGIIQPIVVRPVGNGQHEIIAGERRWRAAQMAGLHEVPVVVRDVSDQAAVAMALIENIQREDLNPLEEAAALLRLNDEFGLTHQQAAEAVGRSRATVTNLLRLLELNDDVKKLLSKGELEMGHARALLGLQGAAQSEAAQRVVQRGLSVRETEQLVRRQQKTAPAKSPAKSTQPQTADPDIRHLESSLSEKLGAPVQIQHSAKGKGKLIIQYASLDELDGILEHIK